MLRQSAALTVSGPASATGLTQVTGWLSTSRAASQLFLLRLYLGWRRISCGRGSSRFLSLSVSALQAVRSPQPCVASNFGRTEGTWHQGSQHG